MKARYKHVNIVVADLHRLATFYQEVLVNKVLPHKVKHVELSNCTQKEHLH